MSLQDCIKKAGKAISKRDADALEELKQQHIADGMTEAEAEQAAVQSHGGVMDEQLEGIAGQAQELGAIVTMEEPVVFEQVEPAFRDATAVYEKVRDNFLDQLPEDATVEDVMESLEDFGTLEQNFLKALDRDDWLGFDYPSQAISAVLGEDIDRYDVSQGLKQSIGRMVNQYYDGKFFQDDKTTKGYYQPSETLIRLTESSDPSTFIHEFAHFMLDMETKANSPRMAAVNDWFQRNAASLAEEAGGTVTAEKVAEYTQTGRDNLTNEEYIAVEKATHEQFARGFEQYVMEGEAPSQPLHEVFRKLSRMLVQVYQSVSGDMRVSLDAGMRQVFDRLIATEEQIEQADARNRHAPLFTDAVMAGMTEEQYAKYKEKAEQATEKASETLRDKLMKELTRVQTKQWNEEKADVIDEEIAKLRTEPVFVARERLKTGTDAKLDRATVKDILGIDKIPPALRNMTVTGKQGAHPDESAVFYGFGSGIEMLTSLIETPKIQDVAAENAEAVMLERHGDILNDGTIEELANEAVKNENRATVLLAEIKALSRGIAVPAIDKKTIREIAAQQIGKLSYSQIRPAKYHSAEIRNAQDAATALTKGDQQAALRAKTQQVMNYYLWREAMDAKLFGDKMTTFAARFNKKSIRETLGKAGNDYLGRIDEVLDRFEFRKSVSIKEVRKGRLSIGQWAESMLNENGDLIALSDGVLDERFVIHWKEVPIEALRGIHDSIASIEHNARSLSKIKIAEEELTYEQAISAMLTAMEKTPDQFKATRTDVVETGSFKNWVIGFNSGLTKMPWLMSWLEGGERAGVMNDAVTQPMTDAYNAKVRLYAEVGKPIQDAINNRSKETVARHNTKITIPEIATENDPGVLYGHQILSVALNAGNAGNLRKMLIGEGWVTKDAEGKYNEADITIDNPQLQAILRHVTPEDMEFVQLTWNQLETMKEPLAAVHKKATGLELEGVEAVPVVINGVEYAGGYYPLSYDPSRSEKARLNQEKATEESLSMMGPGGLILPSARTGARIERTEFTGPIRFNLDVVPNHIEEVVHFITHYEAIKTVNRLTKDPRIAEVIKAKVGQAEYGQIKPWLNAIAKDGREQPIKNNAESLMRRLRFGATYGIMGFKASTGLIQISGLFNSSAEVGFRRILKSSRQILGSDQTIRESWEWAKNNSKVLEHRTKTMDREIKNAMVNLVGKRGVLSSAQEASMMHIALIQTYAVDLPTWYAAVDKGMVDFEGDQERAFKYADWVIENVQGSGVVKDLPAIMRTNSETYKLVTMFMTFFSALHNHDRDVVRGFKEGRLSVPAAAGKFAFLWTLPAIFETLMREGLGEGDDDEETLLERSLVGTALMPLNTIPFVRDAANGLITGYSYNASPVLQIVEQGITSAPKLVGNIATGEEATMAQVKGTSKLLGIAFGVPGVNQAWISSEHLYDVMVDGEDLSMRYLLVTTDKNK